MRLNESNRKLFACAGLAVAALATGLASASEVSSAPPSADPPLVLAQAGTTLSTAASPAGVREFPAYQAGVRAAAAQGPEALRRYVHRTRMIYNFYYWDFASRD